MSSESHHQQALILWARMSRQSSPELEHLIAIPNGAHTTPKNRMRLVREGLVAGVSDLFLPVPRGGYSGLWLEMKSKKGKLRGAQSDWLEAMRKYGHAVHVVYDWDDGRKILQEYLRLK